MGKDHWDAIVASSPLNAAAGRVTGKGVHFTPEAEFKNLAWDECPPFAKMPLGAIAFVDLTGRKFGRLTVVGYLGKLNPKKKTVWVCRCVCGRYEGRHAAVITAAAPDAKCQACYYTAGLREAVSGNGARKRAESEKARKWAAV